MASWRRREPGTRLGHSTDWPRLPHRTLLRRYYKKMHGFRSAFERTRRFTRNVFHEGRKALVHLDRGLTTAAHVYYHVAPILALLATRHMGVERALMAHDSISGAFASYGRVRERAVQANRMVDALHHATNKRTPEL